MEKRKLYESFINGEKVEVFGGNLEGIVREVQKSEEKESILKIKTNKNEKTISVPFKVHQKILLGSKIFYSELEEHKTGFEIRGYTFSTDGPDPIGKPYNQITIQYLIRVLNGEFKGIEYNKRKSKRNYI